MASRAKKTKKNFSANAHLLKLLGDELIGDDRLAIFELVKNSFDADARGVLITLYIDCEDQHITVVDDGSGMTMDDISNKWFEIGTPSKRGKNRGYTKRFKRTLLGEKGVGRLAVHKLGASFQMITKSSKGKEYELDLYWPELVDDNKSITDISVTVVENAEPKMFKGKKTGTYIKIGQLYKHEWTRGDVRHLAKLTTTLIDPFDSRDDFYAKLIVPGKQAWIEDLHEVEDILEHSVYKFKFDVGKDGFSWNYDFTPPAWIKGLSSRSESEECEPLELLKPSFGEMGRYRGKRQLFLDPRDLKGIGGISGEFYVFDRRPEIIKNLPQSKLFKEYLNDHTGVKIYRDGVRVYNYGEAGFDWLGLDAARVNAPAKKMGTNTVIASFSLDVNKSHKLKEKTNREGFTENDSYKTFLNICQSIVAFLDKKRNKDREKLEASVKKYKPAKELGQSFDYAVDKIRKRIEKDKKMKKEIGPHLDSVVSEYERIKEVMLNSGISGLNLSIVFHEVAREISHLETSVEKREKIEEIYQRIRHVSSLLSGFAPLLRKSQHKKFAVKDAISRVSENSRGRFKHHDVVFSCPMLTGEESSLEITAPANLVIGAITNIIDNAIYWIDYRRERTKSKGHGAIKVINCSDYYGVPSLAFLDNGCGFKIEFEEAVKPFVTEKLGGMGLGLYYTNVIVESLGGAMFLEDPAELDGSGVYDGSAIIIKFKGKA